MRTALTQLLLLSIAIPYALSKLYQPYTPWEFRYNHFYGYDNLSMANIFLLPTMEEREAFKHEPDDTEIDDEEDAMPKDFPMLDETLESESNFYDADEYNKIREDLRNMSDLILGVRTRRYSSCRWWFCYASYVDADDWPRNQLWWEKVKIMRLNNLTLSFLIHARYKVREAITVRDLVRKDKRYLLGYLFNRLRRLEYDQRKIFTAASFMEEDYKFRKIYRLATMYKMILRYEVDIKDTIAYIKNIYYNIEDPPMITTEKSKNSKKTKASTEATTSPLKGPAKPK